MLGLLPEHTKDFNFVVFGGFAWAKTFCFKPIRIKTLVGYRGGPSFTAISVLSGGTLSVTR